MALTNSNLSTSLLINSSILSNFRSLSSTLLILIKLPFSSVISSIFLVSELISIESSKFSTLVFLNALISSLVKLLSSSSLFGVSIFNAESFSLEQFSISFLTNFLKLSVILLLDSILSTLSSLYSEPKYSFKIFLTGNCFLIVSPTIFSIICDASLLLRWYSKLFTLSSNKYGFFQNSLATSI